MKDHRITVRFSPETRRRLQAAARRTGKRESDLVREAVDVRLAAEESVPTVYDHLKRAGLIGSVKGTPGDLSTNRNHFAEFGKS